MIVAPVVWALALASAQPPPSSTSTSTANDPIDEERVGRGVVTMAAYECDRCHSGIRDGLAPLDLSDFDDRRIDKRDRSCVDCHRAILDGDIKSKDAAKWRANIVHLRELPALDDAGSHLRFEWLASFIAKPHKLRRGLGESMPRMTISPAEAADVAYAMTSKARRAGWTPPEAPVPVGDVARGRKLLEVKGCGTCHAFTGADVVARPLPMPVDGARLARGMSMAPDLRDTRDRTTRAWMRVWLLSGDDDNGKRVMPIYAKQLTLDDINDMVAAVFDAPLAPMPKKTAPARLPVLERKVRFAEVQERVFSKTCIHCHADDDKNLGVGGPGNSGGFGYLGTGLVLTSYERAQAGSVDRKNDARHLSVFRLVDAGPMKGLPLLVAQLRARQLEEADDVVDGVTGMPLGLPALSPEDLQLVETWVAQGRPQ